jgi:hypothetical protein
MTACKLGVLKIAMCLLHVSSPVHLHSLLLSLSLFCPRAAKIRIEDVDASTRNLPGGDHELDAINDTRASFVRGMQISYLSQPCEQCLDPSIRPLVWAVGQHSAEMPTYSTNNMVGSAAMAKFFDINESGASGVSKWVYSSYSTERQSHKYNISLLSVVSTKSRLTSCQWK